MDEFIITVAPGAPYAATQAFPDLPHTPEQMANEVVRACQAGAAVAHLHVLDEQGKASEDLTAFKRTVALIRERCDIIIEGSTGGAVPFSAAARSVALQADIELASLNPGSVNFADVAYTNSPQDIDYWVKEMQRRHIKAAVTVFDSSWIANSLPYVEQGLITKPLFYNIVLGQTGAVPATARHALFLIETLPAGSLWELTGHSGNDTKTLLWALAFGGHARVGYEDNIYVSPGVRSTSNAVLVERAVRFGREAGREPAFPAQVRSLLGLPARK